MTKKSFTKIILNLQLARKRSRDLYKLGIDLMQYDESYEHVIDELFRAAFIIKLKHENINFHTIQ